MLNYEMAKALKMETKGCHKRLVAMKCAISRHKDEPIERMYAVRTRASCSLDTDEGWF